MREHASEVEVIKQNELRLESKVEAMKQNESNIIQQSVTMLLKQRVQARNTEFEQLKKIFPDQIRLRRKSTF